MSSRRNLSRSLRGGFTLVELLVSVAILAVIMLLVTRMIGDTGKIWSKTAGKIDAFRQARLGFEEMTSELAQATTNTYWDYFNSAGQTVAQYNAGGGTTFSPAAYGRQSELHFISGPSSTLHSVFPTNLTEYTHGVFFTWAGGHATSAAYSSLNSLLNGTGFFVEFSPDTYPDNTTAYFVNGPPTSVLTNHKQIYKFRLVQFIQPTENLAVYNYGLTSGQPFVYWFDAAGVNANHPTTARIVADNVVALIIWPKKIDTIDDKDPNVAGDTALAPNYVYDSRLGLASGASTTTASTPWTPGTGNQPLQMNQMPPILQIAMVSLDDSSGRILQGTSTTAPAAIATALSGLFAQASPLYTATQTISNMDVDLGKLTGKLAAIKPKLNFQVFETTIAIRSAKFSNP